MKEDHKNQCDHCQLEYDQHCRLYRESQEKGVKLQSALDLKQKELETVMTSLMKKDIHSSTPPLVELQERLCLLDPSSSSSSSSTAINTQKLPKLVSRVGRLKLEMGELELLLSNHKLEEERIRKEYVAKSELTNELYKKNELYRLQMCNSSLYAYCRSQHHLVSCKYKLYQEKEGVVVLITLDWKLFLRPWKNENNNKVEFGGLERQESLEEAIESYREQSVGYVVVKKKKTEEEGEVMEDNQVEEEEEVDNVRPSVHHREVYSIILLTYSQSSP